MSHTPVEPVRLADLPPEQDLVGVSPLVRAAAAPLPEITPAARQRIRGHLYGSLSGHDRAPARRVRVAMVLAFTLALGGVVGAATHSAIMRRLSIRDHDTPSSPRETNGGHRISPRPARSAPPESAAVENQPTPAPPLVVPPSEIPRAEMPKFWAPATVAPRRIPQGDPLATRPSTSSPQAPGSPPLSPPPVALAPPPSEAAVLAEAIRKLRIDGDAAAAVTLLDNHRSSFATSVLRPEASAVRIEALLKLGHIHAALSDLDHLPLGSVPRRDEWQVVRGELRATAGRWPDAEADFAAVLTGRSGDIQGDLTERALWGRAVARSRRGDVVGARSDCKEYLRRFPGGRFAGQASQALLSSPSR